MYKKTHGVQAVSLFGLTFDINDSVFNRPMANLQDAYGTAGEGRLVDDHPEGADHGSDSGGRPVGAGHDSGMADGRLVDGRLEVEAHGFGMEHGRLAGDHPADVDHDSGRVHGRPEDEGRDSGMDDHPADLDCVEGLRVSRYQHHRAHTSYGIQPG